MPRKLPALCCLEDTAFSEVSQIMADDDTITYEEVIVDSGPDYRRKLQVKLQSLIFAKGMNINTFVNELTSTIKSLYDIRDININRQIALNHVSSNLDESLRSEAKIFQLAGNESLENLLEFIETKIATNSLRVETNAATYKGKISSDNSRMDKLESMMERVLQRLDKTESATESDRDNLVIIAVKKGHTEDRCFKKKMS